MPSQSRSAASTGKGSSRRQLLALDPGTGRIAFASPQLERALGFPVGSLRGRTLDELGEERRLRAADFAAFISRAAHDLVGPLNQGAALAGLLVARCGEQAGPEGEEIVAHLRSAADRMCHVTDGLTDYLRAIGTPQEPRAADAQAAFDAACFQLAERIGKAAARVSGQALPAVHADLIGLIAVFQQLIDNAIKFHKPEEPPVVEVSARRGESECVFLIRDNGLGIPAGQTQKVFHPFVTIHGRRYPGAGVGLTIAKTLVEANGGRIRMESEPGRGTVVEFTLPAAATGR